MKIDSKKSLQHDLLDTRNEQLKENRAKFDLTPHGKIGGMDVFSWQQPSSDDLSNFLMSFPFPVVWLADENTVNRLYADNPSVFSNIQAVYCYDFESSQDNGWSTEVSFTIFSQGLENVIKLLPTHQGEKVACLCTFENNIEENKSKFHNYLQLFA